MAWIDRIRFRARMLRIAWFAKPIAGADGEEEGEGEGKPEGGSGEGEGGKEGKEGKSAEEEPVKPEDDWKAKSRKNESAAKRERKAREEAERKLKDREDADKSEQEKAVDKAREEAKAEAKAEAEKDRRGDRLEVAVTRLAAKGVDVGEGDEAKTLKFADADDALLRVERGISRGDIDADEIYDTEGKVKTDALTTALAEILSASPHLAAGEGERPKPKGDADTRKGEAASNDLESMSPADHAERKYGTKK